MGGLDDPVTDLVVELGMIELCRKYGNRRHNTAIRSGVEAVDLETLKVCVG